MFVILINHSSGILGHIVVVVAAAAAAAAAAVVVGVGELSLIHI